MNEIRPEKQHPAAARTLRRMGLLILLVVYTLGLLWFISDRAIQGLITSLIALASIIAIVVELNSGE